MEVNAAVQSSESDLETSNNSVRKVGVVDQVSDLSISASGPNTVNEGAGISYTLIVANSGPQDAEDVTATIQLGAGMSFAASSSTSGTCAGNAGSIVTCTIRKLATGSSATITVSTGSAARGIYTTSIEVHSAGTDTVVTNNVATVSTTINAPANGGADAGAGSGGGGSSSWSFIAMLGFLATLSRLCGAISGARRVHLLLSVNSVKSDHACPAHPACSSS